MVCSGIGNWGVTTAIMNLPATTSTIGLLGVPVLALVISVAFLGEILTWSLLFRFSAYYFWNCCRNLLAAA